MREVVLTAASLALTGAVVANAYYQKHQFYPSVVYLTKSSPSMAVSGKVRLPGEAEKACFLWLNMTTSLCIYTRLCFDMSSNNFLLLGFVPSSICACDSFR